MDETGNLINIVLLIICLYNVDGLFRTNISMKWEKISVNGGAYMTINTRDMSISKETSQLLLTIAI